MCGLLLISSNWKDLCLIFSLIKLLTERRNPRFAHIVSNCPKNKERVQV